MGKNKLGERLASDDGLVLAAEGYLFQLEHRGYLKAGAYVPEVVLDHPEVVEQLHHDFARTGSDVQLAFTYYAHRDKLRTIGRENDLENINRQALAIAKKVASETNSLLAGNICNTGVYDPADKASWEEVRREYTEQVKWAAEAGVDYIVAETIPYLGEAKIALEVIKAADLPAVINLTPTGKTTKDGYNFSDALKKLERLGADVVGFNCARGPATMLPLLEEARRAVKIPLAALPVAYRTNNDALAFQDLKNPDGTSAYTLDLDRFLCTRSELADFARQARDIGVQYIGICCGGEPHHFRALARALGRQPEASRYSPDMSQHYILGSKQYAKSYEHASFVNKGETNR